MTMSAEITVLGSLVAGVVCTELTRAAGPFSRVGKGISYPSQLWPLSLCKAVAFEFTEVEEGTI